MQGPDTLYMMSACDLAYPLSCLQVLSISAIGCPMYQLKGAKMVNREYAANFAVRSTAWPVRIDSKIF